MKILNRGLDLNIPQYYNNDTKYRLNKFTITYSENDDVVIYNTLNNYIVLYNTSEFDNILPKLVQMYFYVPEDFQEEYLAENLRTIYNRCNIDAYDKIDRYTILTTTDCNAKCFYCFEKNRHKMHMPDKVAEDLAEYIIEHYNGKQVKLHWFGGEPLYNENAIDIICNKLKDNAINYSSTMVSNAYLIDESKIQKYINLWKIKQIQITLDGINDEYNKIKQISDNAFDTVISNIKSLLPTKINVVIRLNLSMTNYAKLKDVVDYIYDNIGIHKNLGLYATELYDYCQHRYTVDEKLCKLYDELYELNDYICQKFNRKHFKKPIPNNFNDFGCQAINDRELVVMPSGKFTICEHHTDDEFIGSIYDKTMDISVISKFRKRQEKIDGLCNDCPAFPFCYIPTGCGMVQGCNEKLKDKKLKNYINLLKDLKLRSNTTDYCKKPGF